MTPRRGFLLLLAMLALTLSLSSCGAQFSSDVATSTMTAAQRDSAIARSEIPGAKAVNRAFKGAERQADLEAKLDSLP